ncbi:MAG: ABC transporter permease [Candidatus Microsaccharimonas sossegonensis]|uniref:ABC transporter permease n=1 Tax=Candidatus Microsaccharimonas sossegonensis TaxID=2506948 RepID=A0A4Q0AJ39_9BACT|nr:MAG: ABC transporter permease [Candidatus Microsaccharimonas sossegonensis]
MNVVTRGIKNAVRSPIKTGAIVLMFAISIALILSMLVARGSVLRKVDEVKANAGTSITITPAGIVGDQGGGEALTTAQITIIKNTANVSSVTSTLTDRLGTTDTNLTSSLALGSFGARQQRFEAPNSSASESTGAAHPAPTSRINVTGTSDPNSIATNGGVLTISSGATIDGNSSDNIALVGATLATKNNLAVNSTFTAYGKTITVKGIYTTGNAFQDSGIIMPIATVQTLTAQPGAVNNVSAKVNSSDNVASTVATLKTTLAGKADITSQAEQAATSVSSLESIATLTLTGVIAAAGAGALIILLAMILVVRERRREIGVIKAIGGSNKKVIGQFIVEGLTMTVIGAVIGFALGIAVSGPMTTSLVSNSQNSASTTSPTRGGGPGAGGFEGGFARAQSQLTTNLTQVSATLTPQILMSAIGITLLIALLGSAIPAWLTARIRPAEVLRTE